MNKSRLAGHIAGSAVASAVWGTAVWLAPGSPGWWMYALSGLPQVVAAISVVLQETADHRMGMEPQPAPPVRRPSPRPRPALTAAPPVRRKELVR